MSEPELEPELALRGVKVSRRFERSYLEEELCEAVYDALLLVRPESAAAGGPQTSQLGPAAVSAVDQEALEHRTGRRRVVAISA